MTTTNVSHGPGANDDDAVHNPTNVEAGRPMGHNNWKLAVYLLGGLLFLAGAGFGILRLPIVSEFLAWYGNRSSATAGPAAASQQVAPPKAPDSPFEAHAREAGIKACSSLFMTLGKTVAEGAQYAARTQWNKADPDRHSVQSIVGLTFGDGTGAGVVMASPLGQGCEGNLVRVVPIQQSCQAAVNLLPPQSTQAQALAGLSIFDLAGGGQAMLIPAGTGCVVTTTVHASTAVRP